MIMVRPDGYAAFTGSDRSMDLAGELSQLVVSRSQGDRKGACSCLT
jgi:hypothetical protein